MPCVVCSAIAVHTRSIRRRIAAMQWSDREIVTDRSQGVQLEKLPSLVRFCGTDYALLRRMCEAQSRGHIRRIGEGSGLHVSHYLASYIHDPTLAQSITGVVDDDRRNLESLQNLL
jgi:hypothetical protein